MIKKRDVLQRRCQMKVIILMHIQKMDSYKCVNSYEHYNNIRHIS